MGDGGWDIHYGLYENSDVSMRDATLASTNQMLQMVCEISNRESVQQIVDLGCGSGGSTLLLSQQFDADVTGVDLCPPHREFAEKANSLGISERALLHAGSFECMPDEWSGRYDLAWAQESLCHSARLSDSVSEAARVLREDGLFAFSDIMLAESATREAAQAFADVNAIVRLQKPSHYRALLGDCGFQIERECDWSEHLESNFQKMIRQIESNDSRLVGEGVTRAHLDRFLQSLRQRIQWTRCNVMHWGVFVSRKRRES